MKKYKIAVLLTCFNRCQDTLNCLQSVHDQDNSSEYQISVHLTDDRSSDGTAEQVKTRFPETRILEGSGNLFWAGGMKKAMNDAEKLDPDFYLWLNDDTQLYSHALTNLIKNYHSILKANKKAPIVIGSTQDPSSLATTYGGVKIKHKWWPLKYVLIEPSAAEPVACDTMNGNCVLIPREIAKSIGNLDPAFTHYLADHDYGLRAKKKGFSVWLSTGHYGTCEKSKTQRSTKQKVGIKEGLRSLDSPKGFHVEGTDLTSLQEWKVYCKRHGGLFWPVYWLAPYRRLIPTLFR